MKYKKITIIVLAIVAAIAAAMLYIYQTQPKKHLFIFSGQSNMAKLLLKKSFIPTLNQQLGEDRYIIFRDTNRQSQYGKSIQQWYNQCNPAAGDDPKATYLYRNLLAKLRPEIRFEKIDKVTFFWMQGERDAKEKNGDIYAACLEGLITRLEEDLGQKDMNVVIGRLSDHDMTNTDYPHWTLIRNAQVKVAEADPLHRSWVDTDDLNDGLTRDGENIQNNLHYSAQGYDLLGQRFADAAIALIKKQQQQ